MHGARRVGRDVLDVDLLAVAELRAPVGGALLQDGARRRRARRPAGSVRLRKPGPATSTFVDVGVGAAACRRACRRCRAASSWPPWPAPARRCRRDRRARHRAAGPPRRWRSRAPGKRAIGLQRLERGEDAGVHERVDVHRRSCRLEVRCWRREWESVGGEVPHQFPLRTMETKPTGRTDPIVTISTPLSPFDAGLTQVRGSVKQAPVLLDGVAVGHAGDEVGHHGGARGSGSRAPRAGAPRARHRRRARRR